MSSLVLRGALTLAVSLAVACGGSGTRKMNGKVETPKLPPVKPEALRDFDSAMRAVRLGGPEAYEKAEDRLRSAVQHDPKLWEGWHNLGVIYASQGEDRKAIGVFARALSINPVHRPSRLARAEAHRRVGNTAKARSDYEKALEQDPEDRDAGARLASLLRTAEQYEDALDLIRETLRTAGANANVYVELGLIYIAQGRDELAELVLRKAIELDEKQPAIYNAMALLALERGNDQLAFERFDAATSLDPTYRDARFNKSTVLLDAGDYARAKDELLAVVNSDGSDLGALVALGVAYRGLKSYDQARTTWERVVKAARRRSNVRGDALFNLAILEMDHLGNDRAAKAALARFLQKANKNHPKRQEAEERKKELGL